jgi:enamine deaminase RidA (YjgF/YER057c/UK114 family)
MSHLKVIQPEGWQRPPGFSWGMSASGGRLVTVAGQLATERGAMEVKTGQSFAQQFALSLQNVADVVAAAGGQPSDVAMMRAYVRDIEAFKSSGAEIRAAWMKILGKHFPPMTMIQVVMLFDPNALVEIDALAVIQ